MSAAITRHDRRDLHRAGRGGIGVVRVSGPHTPTHCRGVARSLPRPRMAELRDVPRRRQARRSTRASPCSFPRRTHSPARTYSNCTVMADPSCWTCCCIGCWSLARGPRRPASSRSARFSTTSSISRRPRPSPTSSTAVRPRRRAPRCVRCKASSRRRCTNWPSACSSCACGPKPRSTFPEEEIDFLADRALGKRMDFRRQRFTELAETARQGALLRDGLTLVIAGRPNAGKSSLLNRLAGYEAAIVTPVPGTTRDVLRERIAIDGLPLHVLDTAGLREAPDEVEVEGIRRAHRESRVPIACCSSWTPRSRSDGRHRRRSRKLPRGGAAHPGLQQDRSQRRAGARRAGRARGAGLSVRLVRRRHRRTCACTSRTASASIRPAEGALSARTRHLDALRRARAHVEEAHRLLTERHAGELVAQELRDAQQDLGEITGEVSSDELLGRIFASFCIGK